MILIAIILITLAIAIVIGSCFQDKQVFIIGFFIAIFLLLLAYICIIKTW